MDASPDRRVVRTKTALRAALLELIASEGFDAISVQGLVDRADVGRATFYKHFADKEELLRESIGDLDVQIRGRMEEQGGDTDPLLFAVPVFEHVSEVQTLFASLMRSTGSRVVRDRFLEMLVVLIDEQLPATRQPKSLPRSVIVLWLATSLLAVAQWWVLEDPGRTTSEVQHIYRRLVGPALATLVGSSAQ